MTRFLLGLICVVGLGMTIGCGRGSEPTVVESTQTAEEAQAEADAYEAEMESSDVGGGDQ